MNAAIEIMSAIVGNLSFISFLLLLSLCIMTYNQYANLRLRKLLSKKNNLRITDGKKNN